MILNYPSNLLLTEGFFVAFNGMWSVSQEMTTIISWE